MRALATLTLICLMGCASAAPTPPVPTPRPVSLKPICSSVKVYTDAESQDLTKAVSSLDPASIIVVALADYARMRAEARACQAKS